MRTGFKLILFLLMPGFAGAQQDKTDSLRQIFFSAKEDSLLYKTANHLYDYYEEVSRDSAFFLC